MLSKNINKKFNGISIDSRNLEQDDIFIATKGDRYHGNEFVDQKLLDKASFIISDQMLEIDSDKIHIVSNSKIFIKDLAVEFRKFLNAKFIGITGTNGKTSTKELLVRFLETQYNVSYSRGNYNSTISLPLSILEFDTDSDYCVLEIGASKRGEIKTLCDIASPSYGLITNISEAHLSGFNDFKDLINTKMDLYRHIVERDGMYFLNKDDENIKIDKNLSVDMVSFSYDSDFSDDLDYCADMLDIDKSVITINSCLFKVPYKTEAFARNFLASYSIADFIGINKKNIQKVLDSFTLPEGRGDILDIGGVKIINDTYNANLDSMIKGISQLSAMKKNNIKIAVIIADMLELSDSSVEIHKKLGTYINSLDFIDGVYGIGDLMEDTVAAIDNKDIQKKYYINKDLFVSDFKKDVDNYDVVYLKGSRGMSLDTVIKDLF
tara:strand:- start:3979 stop:5286 length:1308 start_codon:yes stop_codon:yes gene_type:complete